jgi:hypothetical protein
MDLTSLFLVSILTGNLGVSLPTLSACSDCPPCLKPGIGS